jgi:putative MATE family efflux protein
VDDHRVSAGATASDAGGVAPPPRRPPGPTPYLERPAWQQVLLLAWPALLQQWLVLAVTLSDRLLAGRFQALGAADQTATQAAQTTAGYLAWFVSSYTVLVSVGTTTLVAHRTGAGDRQGAVLVANQALLLAVVLGLLGTALGLFGLEPLLSFLGLRGPAAAFAVAYLRPLVLLLVFPVVGAAAIAALAGAGDTRTGLWVLGGVAVLNLPLAWLFFGGLGPLPGLGFTGIAVGTAVSQTVGGLAAVGVLWRGRAGLRLQLRLLRPRPDVLRRLLRVSVPAAADSLSLAAGHLCYVRIVNGLGDVAAAAHGIALTWEALAYQSGAAFGTAAITVVGQQLGAGQPRRAARGGWTAFALGAAVMTLMGVVFFALAGPMFRLFCPHPGQRPIVEAGVPVLRLVAFVMPALAACMVLTWALRGAGDTRVPLLFTWVGFLAVRLPLAYLLTRDRLDLGAPGTWPGPNLGLTGAWTAACLDLVVRGLLLVWRFAGGRWQRLRV